jgi:hypothetical protein
MKESHSEGLAIHTGPESIKVELQRRMHDRVPGRSAMSVPTGTITSALPFRAPFAAFDWDCVRLFKPPMPLMAP